MGEFFGDVDDSACAAPPDGYPGRMDNTKKGLITFVSKERLTRQHQAHIKEQLEEIMGALNFPTVCMVFDQSADVQFIPYDKLAEHGFRTGLPRRKLTLGERFKLLFTG